MAWKDPDIEAFRAYWKKRAEARGQVTLEEQRVTFDRDMGMIPLAQGCIVERLELSGIAAEKITPAGAAPGKALLYLHGGGHVIGSLQSHRHLVSRLAAAAGITAFHIDYRLAPEHPYPAALEDAVKAYRQILASGIAPGDIVVGGESAGGNLATALLLKARELALPQPAGLYLLSPWLDMTAAGQSYQKVGARDPIITREGIEMVSAAYLGGKPDNPLTSPVRADGPAADADPGRQRRGAAVGFADLRRSCRDGRPRGEAACLAGDAARLAVVPRAYSRRPCRDRRSRAVDAAPPRHQAARRRLNSRSGSAAQSGMPGGGAGPTPALARAG
jgi:monoterpene epsilon-lactone hydrolase